MNHIKEQFIEAQNVLAEFSTEENFEKIAEAGKLMVNAVNADGKILSCGNGGSMCDAMHFAEELTGRYRNNRPAIAAIAISDVSHMTCVSNDYGYEHVFSRYIDGLGRKGDVLLAISTSGNSTNVIMAAKAAKSKGMKVVGLTGKSGGALAPLCDVELRAPMASYADRAQEIHIKIIHCLIDYIERHRQ